MDSKALRVCAGSRLQRIHAKEILGVKVMVEVHVIETGVRSMRFNSGAKLYIRLGLDACADRRFSQ